MVILISPENDLPNELQLLHQLFESGLQYYHFRKPAYTTYRHKAYLEQIDSKFLNRIMIHNHHELAEAFSLKGIHLEERKWREKGADLEAYLVHFKNNGFKASSSYHEVEDLEAQPINFDYYMLSPVFRAISKPGYKGRGFKVSHIPKKIIGMGGIDAKTTVDALTMGFTGVGALGGIWNAKNPVEEFRAIQNAFPNHTKS